MGNAARALARREIDRRSGRIRGRRRRASGSRTAQLRGSIQLVQRQFHASDLRGCALVIAATGDRGVDVAIARAARRWRIPCNVAGEPALGTFVVPAVARRGGITFAVSTGGASPILARALAHWMARSAVRGLERGITGWQGRLPSGDPGRGRTTGLSAYLRLLRAVRRTLRRQIPGREARRRALRELAAPRLAAVTGPGRTFRRRRKIRGRRRRL
jgi:siroheme synthase (precorrin-2 oxidase/ferrochelatase)